MLDGNDKSTDLVQACLPTPEGVRVAQHEERGTWITLGSLLSQNATEIFAKASVDRHRRMIESGLGRLLTRLRSTEQKSRVAFRAEDVSYL